MARSNWSAEDAVKNAQRTADAKARQAKGKQLDRAEAGAAAGRRRRSV